MVPDLDTLRIASWFDRTALVLCDLRDSTQEGVNPATNTCSV